MSRPGTPRTLHDDFETIERYVVATFARYERAVVELIPALEEPRVADLDLALKRLRFFVETLSGFAVGAAVGAVARSARRGFGEEVRERIGRLVDRIVRGGSLPMAMSEHVPPVHLQRTPDRPLIDTAGSLLLARLKQSIPETRTHVSGIHAEIVRAAPARLPMFASLLELLVTDNASALAFSDQLVSGWQHYTAVVSERRPARPPDAAEEVDYKGPWRAWTHRLTGRAVPSPSSQGEITAKGFLLQIA